MSGLSKSEIWTNLSEEYREHWNYYKNLYSFSLQKPANSIFTKTFYPGFYQSRFLKRKLAQNMQILGKVSKEQVKEFSEVTKKPKNFTKIVNYHLSFSTLKNYWNFTGLFGALTLSTVTVIIKKNIAWQFVPGAIWYCLALGYERQSCKASLGQVVDMTQWVIEKRKAEVWLEQNKVDFFGLPDLGTLKSEIFSMVNKYNNQKV